MLERINSKLYILSFLQKGKVNLPILSKSFFLCFSDNHRLLDYIKNHKHFSKFIASDIHSNLKYTHPPTHKHTHCNILLTHSVNQKLHLVLTLKY